MNPNYNLHILHSLVLVEITGTFIISKFVLKFLTKPGTATVFSLLIFNFLLPPDFTPFSVPVNTKKSVSILYNGRPDAC